MYYIKPKHSLFYINTIKKKKNVDVMNLNELIFDLKHKSIKKDFFIVLIEFSNLLLLKELLVANKKINIIFSKISKSTFLNKQLNSNENVLSFGFIVELNKDSLAVSELCFLLEQVKGNLLALFNDNVFYWFSEVNSNAFIHDQRLYNINAHLINYIFSKQNESFYFDSSLI